MATMITDECIACGACEDECPNEAISFDAESDLFVIDPDLCTECAGHYAEQACQAACPPEVCVPDLNHIETEAELFEKFKRLWPDKAEKILFDDLVSHYKAS